MLWERKCLKRGGAPAAEDNGSARNLKDRSEVVKEVVEAAIAERISQDREREMEERNELVYEWSGHIMRSMKMDDPTYLDLIDTAELLDGEMAKTEFLNSTGFLEMEEKNNFDGLADEALQIFILEQGEGDNKKAHLFVKSMVAEMRRVYEEDNLRIIHDSEDVHEARDREEGSVMEEVDNGNANEGVSNTSKTQQEGLPAEANNAGPGAACETGQVAL